ncbi:MAG: DNA-directed RNA polymerase subunit D [Candidatus Methanoliparum thermophilum]|uniref:DNA-directed RNA polymerase subunit Rpo3 n=1 Tax=Methanoliparum thermophilum TaxID=2491083 RepID=A0A520KTT8_METT2|nr:DNA-directed RNA polymerase subunit D [Candidatus Methanoliparum sp. LAM-1]RZN65499.1 MAG: DNA-directed RNA polymerase subunit D [Candidatus Methanoliparum thermophilum]BDC35406.1 DNA-directed RNA polymerase subunit D [Candidatus Methanoliparum sp. LAM-1]
MIHVEILDYIDTNGKFLIKGVSTAFINAIRRVAMSEIPKLAVDFIRIYDNSSSLYNEMLASRIGLIPLKTDDLEFFKMPNECECNGEGCSSCQTILSLSAEGPKMVYSSDLVSTDSSVNPAYQDIPIVKLYEGQRVICEAIAKLGIGKNHAKWQATTICAYRNVAKIDIINCDLCGDCIKECPKGLLYIDKELRVKNILDCNLCRLCERTCSIDAIRVSLDEYQFIFNIESDGSINVKDIVNTAVDVIENKLINLKAGVAEIGQRRRT